MPRNLNNITQTNGYTVQKPDIDLEWSSFYSNKTNQGTGDCGKIIPVYFRELMPNQKVQCEQDIALQFTPFVSNLFHEIKGELMTFFVPYRICAFMRPTENFGDEEVDDIREEADQLKWEAFITGGLTGKTTIKLPGKYYGRLLERIKGENNGTAVGTLLDYFGFPIHTMASTGGTSNDTAINVLPFNAYNLIYNEKLRNPDFTPWKQMELENKTAPLEFKALETATAYWNADRFTRARKWQQRGITPSIPINSELIELVHTVTVKERETTQSELEDFITNKNSIAPGIKSRALIMQNADNRETGVGTESDGFSVSLAGSDSQNGLRTGIYSPAENAYIEKHTIPAGTTTAELNYNDFLYYLAILKYEVNNARIKPRYTDQLKYRFGIIPQDSRFNEPEFIASHSFNIGVDTNQATGTGTTTIDETTINTAQGNITGQAWGGGRKMGFEYKAMEHGILITLMIVRPIGVYEGGLERFWRTDRTRFDFPTPELMNTPDVEIKKGEIHMTGIKSQDEELFGWQSIYDEYRTETNQVCGLLRPSITGGLGTYTLARFWENNNRPGLNDNFLLCKPDMARIKQYTNQPDFIFFHRNQTRTAAPMPLINEPINI